jgi:ParB family chromosome partitioning protein
MEQQEALQNQLDRVEEQLATFVGFESTQKALAGCFVSIGEEGTPFLDKGLIKPEHRKILGKLLKTGDGHGVPVKAKPRHDMPESLRRDLAIERLPIAQVEIARHPGIALDLLAFNAASVLLGEHPVTDGPNVELTLPKLRREQQPSSAATQLQAIREALPTDWLKPDTEAERFEAFRSLPQEARLELLAYCVALALQPKLDLSEGEQGTAYDAALALTGASVADYWRPTAENFLKRRSREQLLAISREVLGQTWALSSSNEKKSLLVAQLDRAFSDPEKASSDPEQVERLKGWLPAGMSFGTVPTPKPAKGKKARKAA